MTDSDVTSETCTRVRNLRSSEEGKKPKKGQWEFHQQGVKIDISQTTESINVIQKV